MEIRERQQAVLGAVVREFVRSARPVASQDISREHGLDLGVGAATIRNEMLALDELGYLEQPYTSAGRVPTDKGYRFFVDHLLDEARVSSREQERIHDLFAGSDTADIFVKEFSRTISEMTGMFAVAGSLEDEIFYDVGLAQVLREPEFREDRYLEDFGILVDMLDDAMRGLCRDAENKGRARSMSERQNETVFIGKENPLREGRSSAMILSSWRHPAGFEGFLTLVGPRRMDYQRAISLVRCIGSTNSL